MAHRINELRQAVIAAKQAADAARRNFDAVLKSSADAADIAVARAAIDVAREASRVADEASTAAEERLTWAQEAQSREDATLAARNPPPAAGIEVGAPNASLKPWTPGAVLAEFCMAVRATVLGSPMDPRLMAAASGMNEAIGPDGGFAVPVITASEIEREIYDTGDILSRVDVRDISSNAMVYPIARQTSRADYSRDGGRRAYWIDEAGAPDPMKIQLDKVEFKLRKIAALSYITEELREDAPALSRELQASMVEEIQFEVEAAIFRGQGVNRPQGFLSAPAFISAAAEAGQDPDSVINANILGMWTRMRPRDRANAVWLVTPELEPYLDTLAITVGTAALEPRYVQYGPDGVLRIKGRPVIFSEYSSAPGDVGDIVLANLKQYRLVRRGGIQTASSIHVRFVNGEECFRAIYRMDGQVVPRGAVTPYQGTLTTSPFVGLAAR